MATETEKVISGIKSIEKGPKALKLYMDICAKCGTCAKECPVYYGLQEKSLNPAERSDIIRRLYKRYCTTSGKILGNLVGASDYKEGDIDKWAKYFYECTACRRCATFCPMGIDNSVITRKGRAIVDQIGKTPEKLLKVIDVSLKTGNTDGALPIALIEAVKFIEEEIKEETGVNVKIPIDKIPSEVFFVPPSGDVLVNAESLMGIAMVFYLAGIDWTMSSSCFDGANYGLFTGNDAAMKEDNKKYIEEAKKIGCKLLIMGECGHAYRIMKFMCEKMGWWGTLPFKIINVLEFTSQMVKDGKLKFDKSKNSNPVTYHDPCNFGRSCGIIDEPRIIMQAACSDFREMEPHGADNWCCGGGGGLSAMDTIHEFRMTVSGKKKLEQILATGAKYVAAPCSNCKRQLLQLMEYHKLDIQTGGVHDLLIKSLIMKPTTEKKKIST